MISLYSENNQVERRKYLFGYFFDASPPLHSLQLRTFSLLMIWLLAVIAVFLLMSIVFQFYKSQFYLIVLIIICVRSEDCEIWDVTTDNQDICLVTGSGRCLRLLNEREYKNNNWDSAQCHSNNYFRLISDLRLWWRMKTLTLIGCRWNMRR